MTKPIKAELSLQRSNQDHKTISLRLRFGTGKTVTVGMKPYDFALMVTGMSDVDCQVELRNVRLEMESQFRLVLREEQPDCDCAEDDTSCDCWDHPTYSLYLNGMQRWLQAIITEEAGLADAEDARCLLRTVNRMRNTISTEGKL
jgi:hypothetical protein